MQGVMTWPAEVGNCERRSIASGRAESANPSLALFTSGFPDVQLHI
jgi:hypothetical protein